jgi:hypothetical protein
MYRSVRAHGLVGDDANEALFVMGVVLAGSLTNEPKSAALRASRHPDRPPHRVAAYGDAPWRTPRPSHQPALSEQTDGLRDAGASADARLHTRVTMHLLVANFEHPVLASSGKHPSPKHKSAMPSAQAGSGVRQLSPSSGRSHSWRAIVPTRPSRRCLWRQNARRDQSASVLGQENPAVAGFSKWAVEGTVPGYRP